MAETDVPLVPAKGRSLDEVLIAMDVVDTLRHRDAVLMKELDADGREEDLIRRLKEIYAAQGIDVPEAVLKQGVQALEERRFNYEPPKPSLQTRLAGIYISRDRWLKPLGAAVVALGFGWGAYEFGVVQPAKARVEAQRIELTQTIPGELAALRDEVQASTEDAEADRLAETYYQDGMAATRDGEAAPARAALASLKTLQGDLAVSYEVRVVYGPGEPRSGVFRIPDDAPQTRNYYLIVEAVDAAGRVLEVPVTSEEDQTVKRTKKWGQRVSEDDFYRVAADKGDDQIIQNDVIGSKASGVLRPAYSVETPGGAILEW
ncbi:MAG: DUF6384 family protein [Hyphomonas sp.]|uniref:DUF6384 family protein n=1 Tax=Hyphomonas sp. TaxID=87 RepID=UPI003526FEA9